MRVRHKRYSFLAIVSVCIAISGCATTYRINGKKVTESELREYQSAWRPASFNAVKKSGLSPDDRQSALNIIAMSESTGITKAAPCKELSLFEVVPLKATDVQTPTGEKYGGGAFTEDWRVLSCGFRHSWLVIFGGQTNGGRLQVVYPKSESGGWAELKPVE
jgi:hypothetical protein